MIKIIADSTCDISNEYVEMYDIGIANLTIQIGDKTYTDRVDITNDEFYGFLEGLKILPTTAMPSPTEFLKLMIEAVEKEHSEILVICMSSGTSGSYQSAVIAKDLFIEKYGEKSIPVHVVDSRSMSHGSGYLILKCAKLRELGFSFDELVEFCETYKLHVKHFLSVDDLDHLIKSGRLTNASALIGKLLKLKPIMSMRDGKGAIIAKERGRKNVMDHYIQEFIKRNDPDLTDFIIIGYTSDRTYAENLKMKLLDETGFDKEIMIMQMGMAVGTHVGLGGLSMYFMEKDRNHDGMWINQMNEYKKRLASLKELAKKRNGN